MSEPSNLNPCQPSVEQALNSMAQAAISGVQSTSVDGMNVTRMSATDRKILLDELKKAEIKRFPISFFNWK